METLKLTELIPFASMSNIKKPILLTYCHFSEDAILAPC